MPHPASILFVTPHGPATPLGVRYDTMPSTPGVNEAAAQDAAARLSHPIKPADGLKIFGVGTKISGVG